MVKKAASTKEAPDLAIEFDGLPVTESEAVALPVVPESDAVVSPLTESESEALPVSEANVEAPSEEGDKDHQDVKSLSQRIAELEDKLVHLELELSSHLNKKKNKKERKKKKVKCKCKDKTVDIAKCKCESKKIAQ